MSSPKENYKKGEMSWPIASQLFPLLPEHIRSPNPSIYLTDNYVVVDYETTTIDYGSPHNEHNRVILASWKCGPGHETPGLFRKVGDSFAQRDLTLAVLRADIVVAHEAKFELGWLERQALNTAHIVTFCTKIGEKVLAGNRMWDLHLDGCLRRRGWAGKDPIGRLIRLGVDTLNIPVRWLGSYCDKDVLTTEQLFLDQRAELHAAGQLPVTFTRNILTPVLYDIEKHGLHLDKDRVDAVYNHYLDLEAKLSHSWAELSGGVNPRSAPQKIQYLYKDLGIPEPVDDQGKAMLTPGNDPSTDAPAIQALKLRTRKQKDAVAALQELTSVRNVLSKYVGKLKECVDNAETLFATFNQTVAQTHRLSSTGRNYSIQHQNFQRSLRPVVCARNPGWGIGDGDAANIEFRAAVDLAKDAQGLADIKAKVDIHENTARVIYASEWDEGLSPKEGVNKGLRQDAKSRTFKPLYGGQSGTPVERAYFELFRERYPAVSAMQRGWTEDVLRDKQLRLASGLIFYWPGAKLSRDGRYIKFTTQIYDYPVQSIATAEMCTTATVYLWHLMRAAKMLSFLINIVHDSAVGEIHPDEREQWSEYLKYCFNELIVWYLKEVYDYEWVTPLESDVSIKPYWDESEGWMDQWKKSKV